ncbi:methyltransferase [Alteromonas flava]|uniref:methyltransferase n=1 Tax=Alteromonas flava TaxID=2048003 RepID=UPI000C295453|nr:methyltransferase [Alteromonas flava]
MSTTTLAFADRSLELYRYPAHSQHKSLQAWDAADVLILEHLLSLAPENLPNSVTLLNDEFGALACLLRQQFANLTIYSQSDSWISHQATRENLAHNHLSSEIALLDSLQPLPASALVIVKIPRSLAFLEFQLSQIQQHCSPNTRLIAGAKVTALTPNIFKLFERYIGPVTTSLAKKKSRLVFSELVVTHVKTPAYPSTFTTAKSETGVALTLVNHANVFSRQSLDIGARVMLHHLPDAERYANAKILDLGCGNGVLGIAMLAQAPHASMTFVDESYMALASAQAGVAQNLPDQIAQCDYIASNGLDALDKALMNSFDLVLCNPPFHQQNVVTEHIARQMFKDAFRFLARGGELRIVANRHLPYGHQLKRLFGGFRVLASERKFVILSAIKR